MRNWVRHRVVNIQLAENAIIAPSELREETSRIRQGLAAAKEVAPRVSSSQPLCKCRKIEAGRNQGWLNL